MKIFINRQLADKTQVSGGFSQIIELNQVDNYAIQAEWYGYISGTIGLAASCEDVKDPSITPPTHFVTIASTVTSLASTSGEAMFNVEGAGYRFVKIDLSAASGTGLLDVWYHGKGI